MNSWRLSAASSQTAINDKGLFFGRCASSVDVLEHDVCRQQRTGGVCCVPEVVDIIYSDAQSHEHQRIATDAGRGTAVNSSTTQNVPWNVTMRNLKCGDQRNPPTLESFNTIAALFESLKRSYLILV